MSQIHIEKPLGRSRDAAVFVYWKFQTFFINLKINLLLNYEMVNFSIQE